jgi:hypothetical protein
MPCVKIRFFYSLVKPMAFVKRHLRACLALGLIFLIGGAVGYSHSESFSWMAMVVGAILLGMCRVTTFTAANEDWHGKDKGEEDGA